MVVTIGMLGLLVTVLMIGISIGFYLAKPKNPKIKWESRPRWNVGDEVGIMGSSWGYVRSVLGYKEVDGTWEWVYSVEDQSGHTENIGEKNLKFWNGK